jgi:hypothetical protein
MSLAFDFVPKKVGDLLAPNNHTSLRIESLSICEVRILYCIVQNRFRPGLGSQPMLEPMRRTGVCEESGRDSDYGELVFDR